MTQSIYSYSNGNQHNAAFIEKLLLIKKKVAEIQTSLAAQLVKNPPAILETWVQSLSWEDPLERERLPTLVFWPGEFHGLHSP